MSKLSMFSPEEIYAARLKIQAVADGQKPRMPSQTQQFEASKLTQDIRAAIRSGKYTQQQIADMLSVTLSRVKQQSSRINVKEREWAKRNGSK